MATIIAPGDFIGQNLVPDKDMVGENLQNLIDKYEVFFLRALLGDDLYNAYVATPAAARFAALIPYIKPSEVDFVYWFWMEDQQIQTLGVGTGQTKKQNATTSTPYPKMVRSWNEMVYYNKETHKFLDKNAATYPEYKSNLPTWFYVNGWFPSFDYNWFWEYGCKQIPEIYRLKNRFGI